MKTSNLALIFAAATLAPVPVLAEVDASEWETAELIYVEEYDAFMAAPTLGDDPFQQRLTWSDKHGEYVSVATLKHEERQAYNNQLVWSDFHGDYLTRAELNPCPDTASIAMPLRVASLF